MSHRATRASGFVCLLLAAAGTLLAEPRIIFIRRIPPAYSLAPAEEIAVIYAIGDNESIETFLDVFVDHTNRVGSVRLTDVTPHGQNFVGERPDDKTFRRLRREHRADAYIGINRFTCQTTARGGEGSTTDLEGARVKRKHRWIDAICRARIDVLDAKKGERILTYEVSGEGTSPRLEDVSEEERTIALDQAARYAAIVAAERITPREIRETIELEQNAPSFEKGMSMIEGDRLREARALWEATLRNYPSSPALLYNLGAVSEAMGDLERARDYFERASRLAPGERRFRGGIEMFRRRNGK
jgi:tetratricopeptide (TPR) repeat protein